MEDPPILPGAPPAEARGRRFPCRNCGAETTWDPEADALSCSYCGTVTSVERGDLVIVERALEEAGDAARGLGVEVRVARCGSCGAQVTHEARSIAGECVFCGSAQVLDQDPEGEVLRPESLVPLDVGRERVERQFRAWISGLWFRPSALRHLRDFQAVGVYVPFWTFDARVRSQWRAEAGWYYTVMEPTVVLVRGKPTVQLRPVTKIRWEPAAGARDDTYDDLLVHASKGLNEELARKLGGFDTSQLVPYRPEYLAGWRAEQYAVDLETGWNTALARIEATQQQRCAGDVPGDTHRDLRVHNRVSDVRWKHVLLPLWTLSFRWRGRNYPVLVHGQTGRVVGRAPISVAKILGLVAAVLGGVLLLLALLALAGSL